MSDSRWVRQGVQVGLIAFVAVALFYAAFDVLASRGALYSVNQLGRAVFRGVRDTGGLGLPTPIDVGAVSAYTAVHLALSLLIGLVVLRIVHDFVAGALGRPLFVGIIVGGGMVTVGVVGALSGPLREVLPWWSIVVANLLAAGAAGVAVLRWRPDLVSRLRGRDGRGSDAPSRGAHHA